MSIQRSFLGLGGGGKVRQAAGAAQAVPTYEETHTPLPLFLNGTECAAKPLFKAILSNFAFLHFQFSIIIFLSAVLLSAGFLCSCKASSEPDDMFILPAERPYDEFGGKSADRTFTILTQDDWTAALASISAGTGNGEENYWIDIADNVSVAGSTPTFGTRSGIAVIIRSEDKTLSLESAGNLIKTAAGQTVSIRDNLTLAGFSGNNTSVVDVVINSDFVMSGNTKITGNTAGAAGGGVRVTGGTFTMTGSSSVAGNTATGTSAGDGGGVSISSGFFYMTGNATVSGNTAGDDGGGIMMTGGFFMMSGSAKITGNISHNDTNKNANGGGIYLGNGTFVMKDSAEISGNTSWSSNSSSGAGIEMAGSSVFRLGGGLISGCDTSHDAAAHDPSNPTARDSCNVNWNGTAELTGAGAALRKAGGGAEYGPVDEDGAFTGGATALALIVANIESTIHVINGVLQ
jgi:hypothetical protein